VTRLRQKMIDELVRRNYSEGTIRAYLRSVQAFAEYFNRPPDQLGPEQIREYAAHLFEGRQLSSSSVSQQVAALRFFYVKTFRKAWSVEDTPYPKREKRLPLILSVEEVSQLIDAADTLYHRTLLMTAFGTGARRAEIVNLEIADIDKSMKRIHIREGKGGKDREVPLSPCLVRGTAPALPPPHAQIREVTVPRRPAAQLRRSDQRQLQEPEHQGAVCV
jgi:integrase/recombinase XerD